MVPSSLPLLLLFLHLFSRGEWFVGWFVGPGGLFGCSQTSSLSLNLLERHLQDRVLCLEGTDLLTQRIYDCLWVDVHVGNSSTYNGRMSNKDSGAVGNLPAKSGAIPAYTEEGELVNPAVRFIDNIMKGMRVCCRGKGRP